MDAKLTNKIIEYSKENIHDIEYDALRFCTQYHGYDIYLLSKKVWENGDSKRSRMMPADYVKVKGETFSLVTDDDEKRLISVSFW